MTSTWDKYHEKLIRKWAEMAKTYSIMHSLCAQYYSKWHKRLGVPVVLLGGIAASSIFSNNHNDPEDTEFWNYINGGITLLMTGLAGITNFLSLEEKTSKHQNASYKYVKIGLDIDTLLSFSRDQRSISPEEFMQSKKAQILEIRENVPEILTWVMSEYLNKFNHSLIDTSSSINKKNILYPKGNTETTPSRDESKVDSLSDISSRDKDVVDSLEEISKELGFNDDENSLENELKKVKMACGDKILSDFNDEGTDKVYKACAQLKSLNKVINYSSDSEESISPKEQV